MYPNTRSKLISIAFDPSGAPSQDWSTFLTNHAKEVWAYYFPSVLCCRIRDSSRWPSRFAQTMTPSRVLLSNIDHQASHTAAERLRSLTLPISILSSAKLAAIGPATAGVLRLLGLPVDFVPTRRLEEQIAIELPIEAGQRALLLRAGIASESLAQGLIARGVDVTDVDAYRTVRPPSRSLDLTQVDAATFTSSSTTRNFPAMLDGDGRDALNHVAIFCIGPVTADTARELGLRVGAVAKYIRLRGL